MANEHLKTAARNLERAVSDMRNAQQQVRIQAEDQKRALQQKINDLRNQQDKLSMQMNSQDNSSIQSDQAALVAKLQQEIKDTERTISEINSNVVQEVQGYEQQAQEFSGLVQRLDTMA